MILKNTFFMLTNNTVFGETMENMKKFRDIKTCHNRKLKKKLFGLRTKLSYWKFIHRKFTRNRQDKNPDPNE